MIGRRLLALLLAVVGTPAHAITLEAVLESVDQHYPEIRAANADATAQEYLITRARGKFDPVLSASYTRSADGYYQYEQVTGGAEMQIPGTPIKVGGEWDRLNGRVPVYDGNMETGEDGRIKSYVQVPLMRNLIIDPARAGVQSAIFRHGEELERARLVKLNTYRLAAVSYWTWAAAVERQKIYDYLLNIARERDKFILARTKRGEAARIDHIDNQRVIMQRQAQLEKARLEANKAMLVLGLFYRNDKGQPVRLQPTDAPPEFKAPGLSSLNTEELRVGLVNHPSVTTLENRLKRNEVNRRLTKYSMLPRLDAKFTRVDWLGDPAPPRGEEGVDNVFGLTFEFPLFNREARGEANAARRELDATTERLTLARQKLDVDFEKTLVEAKAMAEIFRLVSQEAAFAGQVEEAERKRFKEGFSSLLTVNLREQDAILARLRGIDALLDFRESELELRLISNTWVRKY